MNFRVTGQKIDTTTSVKYLGVYLNDSLTWKIHFKNLIPKLNRAIGLFSKVRHYTPKFLFKTIYYSLFNSHLIYGNQIWGQTKTKLFQELVKLQNKAIRIINFLPFNGSNINKTYNDLRILKQPGFISLQNSLFVRDCFEKEIPNPFINYFQKSGSQHSHRTRSTFKNCAFVPKVNKDNYGKKSVKYQCTDTWNKYQKQFKIDLLNRRRPDVKKLLTENFLKSYLESKFSTYHTFLPFSFLHFTFISSFSSLIPYSYSQLSINLSPF